MRLFGKVAVIGTGLIGGSLALALKKQKLAEEIVGVSRHESSLSLAKKRKAIDSGAVSLEIIKGADLLIFAAPVETILDLAPKASKLVNNACLVTDVASTKEKVVFSLQRLFPNYVGSHPLAGSEKRGILNAHAGLFLKSLCIITPTKKTNKRALNIIKSLWSKCGARTALLTPAKHDRILSFVSHLPHIAAFSLINTVPPNFLKYASTGLKDTTRIAASDSELWGEIFLSNKKNILMALESYSNNITKIKTAVKKTDRRGLIKLLAEARNKRSSL